MIYRFRLIISAEGVASGDAAGCGEGDVSRVDISANRTREHHKSIIDAINDTFSEACKSYSLCDKIRLSH